MYWFKHERDVCSNLPCNECLTVIDQCQKKVLTQTETTPLFPPIVLHKNHNDHRDNHKDKKTLLKVSQQAFLQSMSCSYCLGYLQHHMSLVCDIAPK